MQLFTNLKTSTKMILFTLLLASFTAGLGGYAYLGLAEIAEEADSMYEDDMRGMDAIDALQTEIVESVVAEKNVVACADDAKIKEYFADYQQQRKQAQDSLAAVKPFFQSEKGKPMLEELQTLFSQWLQVHDQVVVLGNTTDAESSAKALTLSSTMAREKKTALTKHVEAMARLSTDAAHESDQQIAAAYKHVVRVSVGICAVAVFLGVALGLLFARALMHQLGDEPASLAAIAKRIAGGDLKARFDETRPGIGVFGAVKHMTETLKNKLGFAEGVLRGITTPSVVVDANEKLLFLNQQIIDYIERSGKPDDYVGTSAAKFFYNDESRRTVTGQAIAQKQVLGKKNVAITSMTGRSLVCNIDSSPIYDLDGKLIAGITQLTDLTEVVEQQHAAKAATARGILQAAERIEGVVEIVTSASEELSAQVEQASRGAEEQAGRVGETATAMEEMNATVLEVAKNASNAAETSGLARDKAEEGADLAGKVDGFIRQVLLAAQQSLEDMGTLGKKADGIGNVLNVISDIADQTNLLALNAAIEAARAGEAGRGFAVVADEVRKLAEKTMLATKEVGEAIQGIQYATRNNYKTVEQAVVAIGEVTELAGKTSDVLGQIVSLAEQTAEKISSIATASEQQSSTSEEINRAIEDVNRISSETSDAMRQSAQAVVELANQAQTLRALVLEMKADGGDHAAGRSLPGSAPRRALALS